LSNLRSSRSTGSRSSAVAAVCWDAGKEHGGPQAPIQQQQQSRQEQQQHQQSVPQRAYMLGQLPQPSQAKLQLGKPVTMQLWQYQQLQMQQSSQQGSPARGSELSTKDSSGSASADGGGASICSVAGSGPSIRPERGSSLITAAGSDTPVAVGAAGSSVCSAPPDSDAAILDGHRRASRCTASNWRQGDAEARGVHHSAHDVVQMRPSLHGPPSPRRTSDLRPELVVEKVPGRVLAARESVKRCRPGAQSLGDASTPRAVSPMRIMRQASPFPRAYTSYQSAGNSPGTPLPPRPQPLPPQVYASRCGGNGRGPGSWGPTTPPPPPCQQVFGGVPVESGCDHGSEDGDGYSSVEASNLYFDPAVERIEYSDLTFVEHLGSGEFGQVCRGTWRDKEVAIKQLFWDNTSMPEAVLKDLAKEIESFRHLRHKRLVQFVGACLEIPHPCLVTEYMPGGSLHHLLHVRRLHLPLLHGLNMCLQLADGVMYLHSRAPCVVHRDLKSQNVVLDLNLNIKLCDFGLTEPMEATHITKRNNGGSPRYMAPELFDHKTKITEKVDLWAMGCIFIEIFGRTLPYEGINTLAELTREMLVHRRAPGVPFSLPDALKSVIGGCHEFDHRLRPSGRQVFDQLKAVKKQLRDEGAL